MPKGVTTKPHAGRFKPGQSGNPAGSKPGVQSYIVRANNLLDTLSVGEIIDSVIALRIDPKKATTEQKKLHKKVRGMSARDMTIMMRIADGFTQNGGQNLDRLLDRIIGKPTDHVKIDQTVNDKSADDDISILEIEQWIRETIQEQAQTTPPTSLPH